MKTDYLELMESLPVVYLSTLDSDGYPVTRAMLNMRNVKEYPHMSALYKQDPDQLIVYLTTNHKSAKVAELQHNGKASLYYCDTVDFYGLLLRGNISIVTDMEVKRKIWVEGWEEMYYPEGVASEDFTVLKFVPDQLKAYSDLSVVTETIL